MGEADRDEASIRIELQNMGNLLKELPQELRFEILETILRTVHQEKNYHDEPSQ